MERNTITTIIVTLLLVGTFSTPFGIAPASGLPEDITEANLIKNPGFEEQLKFWSVSTGTATYSADNAVFYSGSYSAKGVEIDTGSLGRLYQDVTDIVTPGKRYKISGWIKTEDVTGQVVIGLDYVDSNGWTPAEGYVKEIGYATGSTDWTYLKAKYSLYPLCQATPQPSGFSLISTTEEEQHGGTMYHSSRFPLFL